MIWSSVNTSKLSSILLLRNFHNKLQGQRISCVFDSFMAVCSYDNQI